MNLIEHYIRLFAVFSQCIAFQTVKLTRSEISGELQCSERNVTNIFNKMADKNWIERKKGEGRGNVTTITFLKTIEDILDYFESHSPKYNDIHRLISLLEKQDEEMKEIILKAYHFKRRKKGARQIKMTLEGQF
jgi:SgrR family transcriptional regulator